MLELATFLGRELEKQVDLVKSSQGSSENLVKVIVVI